MEGELLLDHGETGIETQVAVFTEEDNPSPEPSGFQREHSPGLRRGAFERYLNAMAIGEVLDLESALLRGGAGSQRCRGIHMLSLETCGSVWCSILRHLVFYSSFNKSM